MATRKKRFTTPQKVVLVIIILSMITVIVSAVCIFLFKPENTVKAKISELSADYYENYLYPSFNFEGLSSEELSDFMKKYETNGLTAVPLRQLLLYDHQKNADAAPLLKKYCDEDATLIRVYPEPPYSKTSYHIDYIYACEF